MRAEIQHQRNKIQSSLCPYTKSFLEFTAESWTFTPGNGIRNNSPHSNRAVNWALVTTYISLHLDLFSKDWPSNHEETWGTIIITSLNKISKNWIKKSWGKKYLCHPWYRTTAEKSMLNTTATLLQGIKGSSLNLVKEQFKSSLKIIK